MLKGYTHVTFVLDNSGSMLGLIDSTIEGYNGFINKQKQDPGKMTFSLYEFKTPGKGVVKPHIGRPAGWPMHGNTVFGQGLAGILFDPMAVLVNGMTSGPMVLNPLNPSNENVWEVYRFIDLKNAPTLSHENYQCDTNTPLLDAMGVAMRTTGEMLSQLDEDKRPENVIFVTLTDGEENASREFSAETIKAMTKHQTEIYNWDFIFLGANQDSIVKGASYGVLATKAMNFATNDASVGGTYASLSGYVTRSKTMGSASVNNAFTAEERTVAWNGGEVKANAAFTK